GDLHGFEHRKRHSISKRLRRGTVLTAHMLQVDPLFRALGICGTISRAHFANFWWERVKFGGTQSPLKLEVLDILHAANAVCNNEGPNLFGERQGVIVRNAGAACSAEQMEAIDMEVLRQIVKIICCRTRLSSWLGGRAAPAAAVVGNHPESGSGEFGDLVCPIPAAARIRMEHD